MAFPYRPRRTSSERGLSSALPIFAAFAVPVFASLALVPDAIAVPSIFNSVSTGLTFDSGAVAGLCAGLVLGVVAGAFFTRSSSASEGAWIDVPRVYAPDLFANADATEATFPIRTRSIPPSVDVKNVIAVDDGADIHFVATIQKIHFFDKQDPPKPNEAGTSGGWGV